MIQFLYLDPLILKHNRLGMKWKRCTFWSSLVTSESLLLTSLAGFQNSESATLLDLVQTWGLRKLSLTCIVPFIFQVIWIRKGNTRDRGLTEYDNYSYFEGPLHSIKSCRANDPFWLVAAVTSLPCLSLCCCLFWGFFLVSCFISALTFTLSLPLTQPPQLEVFPLGWRPRSRISWLEALLLLLFPALWCHRKEGPAIIPGAVSQS